MKIAKEIKIINVELFFEIKSVLRDLKDLSYKLNTFLIRSLIFLMLIFITNCSSQTNTDKSMLRKQCHIPEYANLVYFKSYPDELGFGQREGIEIEGRYKLLESDVEKFEIEAYKDNWQKFPIPDYIIKRINQVDSTLNLKINNGLYRCYTAGNNVEYAQNTTPLEQVKAPNDLIISIYNREYGQILALIKSKY
jgi:hypothetical protein